MKKLLLLVLIPFMSKAQSFVTPELHTQMLYAQMMILESDYKCDNVIDFQKYIREIEVTCDNGKYSISHSSTDYIVKKL